MNPDLIVIPQDRGGGRNGGEPDRMARREREASRSCGGIFEVKMSWQAREPFHRTRNLFMCVGKVPVRPAYQTLSSVWGKGAAQVAFGLDSLGEELGVGVGVGEAVWMAQMVDALRHLVHPEEDGV